MDSLSTELLCSIASHLPQSSVPALLQTCQRWQSASLSILYRHPVLRDDIACLAFVKTLERQPSYARYICDLTIDNPYIQSQVAVRYPFHLTPYLAKILPLVKPLFTLSVEGPSEDPHRCFLCPQNRCLDWSIEKSEVLVQDYIMDACYDATGPLKNLISCEFFSGIINSVYMPANWIRSVSWGDTIEFEDSLGSHEICNTPFFVHPHLRHLKLKNGWIGFEEILPHNFPPTRMSEDENPIFPEQHNHGTTQLEILELEDFRILPRILDRFLMAPKALTHFSFQEFFAQSDQGVMPVPCNEYLAPLLMHKDTLQFVHLHLFKIPENYRWSQGSCDLASFTCLKTLSVDLITLFGDPQQPVSPWLGTHSYLPKSLEVLEFRAVVDAVSHRDGWNEHLIKILSKVANESPVVLPRLRILRLQEMRIIPHLSSSTVKYISIDYTQFIKQFASNGIHFSTLLYGDYRVGYPTTWDSRVQRTDHVNDIIDIQKSVVLSRCRRSRAL